jgi:hypothetical protein
VFFEITGISDTTITVRGDARSQVDTGGKGQPWYFIIPPVGLDKETAALDPSPEAYPSRYLAFHYRYMPPMAGVSITSAQNSSVTEGIHGYQEGLNHQGQYQAWHRMYNPTTGRWTTPDPASSLRWNLVGFDQESEEVEDIVPPWGDLTEKDPDPRRGGGCSLKSVETSDGWSFGRWEIQSGDQPSRVITDTSANKAPGENRRSWNMDAGNLIVRFRFDVTIWGNPDLNKWFTCQVTCHAEGVYTYIEGRLVSKSKDLKATIKWNFKPGPSGIDRNLYDSEGNRVSPRTIGRRPRVSNESWTTYHRFPCRNDTIDIAASVPKKAVSVIWDRDAKRFVQTAHHTVYHCTATCGGTTAKTVKIRGYDPALPHGANGVTAHVPD